ncbi:hypothetical protein B0H14DRAFT_2600367 [Mycena olivaceomarginata]|nr:hypothetical protein B0H14DRAFT_2600367 [Mycena olivaceomarginata]
MARARVERALLPTALSRPASDVARERLYTVQCAFLAPILGQSQSLQDWLAESKRKESRANTTFKNLQEEPWLAPASNGKKKNLNQKPPQEDQWLAPESNRHILLHAEHKRSAPPSLPRPILSSIHWGPKKNDRAKRKNHFRVERAPFPPEHRRAGATEALQAPPALNLVGLWKSECANKIITGLRAMARSRVERGHILVPNTERPNTPGETPQSLASPYPSSCPRRTGVLLPTLLSLCCVRGGDARGSGAPASRTGVVAPQWQIQVTASSPEAVYQSPEQMLEFASASDNGIVAQRKKITALGVARGARQIEIQIQEKACMRA